MASDFDALGAGKAAYALCKALSAFKDAGCEKS